MKLPAVSVEPDRAHLPTHCCRLLAHCLQEKIYSGFLNGYPTRMDTSFRFTLVPGLLVCASVCLRTVWTPPFHAVASRVLK